MIHYGLLNTCFHFSLSLFKKGFKKSVDAVQHSFLDYCSSLILSDDHSWSEQVVTSASFLLFMINQPLLVLAPVVGPVHHHMVQLLHILGFSEADKTLI